ncbi:hypothetical protein Q4566_10705 [Tamlana sp. 2_MG-2023]|uniref:hypothetical protein n=1 Tax=unclassified Tamlana TaxID=2614803 RepID=UPI0026E22A92|nr:MULTISPECIES: hypothetical protein [unclassified Tamlana]MDO6760670.1 hypothetical protein [Tamlana sp. 2_MG-2023]MDO6790926.1 hypothetical protein [Tamlana sp. 1_MG-2023]
MGRNLLVIVLLLICISSCKEAKKEEKQVSVSVIETNEFQKCIRQLTFYDDYEIDIHGSVRENDEGFFLNKKKIKKTDSCIFDYLNSTHTNHSDDFFYNIDSKKYYPVFKKKLENRVVVGSFVEYYGENDIPGVLLQLNLFDLDGNQVDYLIVFNRFSFEISIQYDFMINEAFSEIEISKIEEDWILFDDEGEMIERKEPLISKEKEVVRITKNGFVKK